MSQYLLQDTPLAHMEKTMMRPPSYRPRGGGVYISHYKYTTADCDCRYCVKADKKKKHCQGAADCVCFEERLAASCWTHGELAQRLIREVAMMKLSERTRRLLPPKTYTPFKNQAHHQRMTSIAAAVKRESLPYTAAAFLLSADTVLWNKSLPELRVNDVDFSRLDVRGITHDGYTLLQTAKDLYRGGCIPTTDELSNPELVGDELFRLIISAFVIRRYGFPAGILG